MHAQAAAASARGGGPASFAYGGLSVGGVYLPLPPPPQQVLEALARDSTDSTTWARTGGVAGAGFSGGGMGVGASAGVSMLGADGSGATAATMYRGMSPLGGGWPPAQPLQRTAKKKKW